MRITDSKRWMLGLVLACATTPMLLAGGISDFTFTKAIPADAYMAVHARQHGGMEFLNKQNARVWKAIEDAKFENDIRRLAKELSKNDLDEAEFEKRWQQMTDLAAGVKWGSLTEREFAFAMKQGFPNAEFILLFKPPAENVTKDFEGLSAILKTLQSMEPGELALTTDGSGERQVHKVSVSNSPFPISMTLAREKDVILCGFGAGFVEQSLALLRGESGPTLAASERFQEAFKALPPPADGAVFVDVAKIMGQIRGMISQGIGMGKQYSGDDPEQGKELERIERIANKGLDAIDLWEYVAEVSATDGLRTTTDGVTVLRADARSRLMYQPFYGTGTLSDPLKYIPKEAGSVTITSGADLAALYRNLVGFVKAEIPEAAQPLSEWDAMQEMMELNIERDVLGWMQGHYMQFSIPGPTPFSPASTVMMMRVSNEAKAQEMLDMLFEKVEPLLKQQQGAIEVADIEGAEGFRSVMHPMVALVGMKSPTLGVKDGWVFFGSSTDVLQTVFATAAGKHESFAANERFRKEAVAPGANLVGLSFTDQTKLGEELGQMLQMVPMVVGFMPSEIRDNPAVQFARNAIGKFGRVARTFDYFQSNASMSTFDGKRVVTRTIQNYRDPKAAAGSSGTR